MPDDPSAPQPTPTNYQRTTGGSHLRWVPPTPEHLQEMLPAYEILSILGQGGMGAVYKGRQKSLDRIVAIKILPPEAGEDDMQFVERFKNEARTMAKMNHPAIVHVYDFGETTEGQLYIVMEFIDGTDVAKMIQEKKKLPEDYALSITAHVCDALGYAHTQGVVHRDIKPANVLINMAGQVKVADFGLAKATDPSQMGLTKTNMAMGTPDFVSPEALMPGVPLDGRADLYAVGVMLFNMLTGTIPRGAFRMPSVTHQTDARFDKIIGKAMEMDRELRYQTALELRRDLDVILTTPAAKTGMQTIPAQAALPQKPMGKSPSAPQQKPAASAGKPTGSAKPPQGVAKPATGKAAPAPAPKSNAGMLYGIAAAVVVIAVAIFLFSGGGKKPAAAPQAVAEDKSEPKKPATKPSVPAPVAPPSKPAAKPTAAPATVATGKEQWVDGLAQWFGGTKTNDDFVREANGSAKMVGDRNATLAPVPAATPLFRDQALRVRARIPGGKGDGDLRLCVRYSAKAGTQEYVLRLLASDKLTLTYHDTQADKADGPLDYYAFPAGFDPAAVHTVELRIVGDLMTASVDGHIVGDKRDARFTEGHPAITAHKVTIESFEYANLDPGGSIPVAPTKPADVLTFGGHRYQVFLEPLTWPAAKAKAEAMGGHLATITSKEEADFVTKTIGPSLIGLSDIPSRHGIILGASWSAASNTWQCDTGETFDLEALAAKRLTPKRADARLIWSYRGERWDFVGNEIPLFSLVEWDDDGSKPAFAIPAAPQPAQVAAPAATSVMPAAAPAPAPPADPRLAQLEAGFKARYEADAQKPFLAALSTLNQSYVANGISRARAAAQAKGSLAEVTALDAEKAAIEKGSGVPVEDVEGTPESLKALRSTYRGALSKITTERDAKAAPLLDLYLKALDVYVAELTKAGKIDEAKQVQALRDAKATQKPGEEAKAAPPPTATADDPAAPKITEREVAEWLLSLGAEVSIDGQTIKEVASLPAGKITLKTVNVPCGKITNADLGRLSVCRDLTVLNLTAQLPDRGIINLEPIRKLTKLRELTCYPPHDSTGMDIIAGLKDLTKLVLGDTKEGAFEKIAELKELQSLRVTPVASLNFAKLKSCKQLRTLDLLGHPCLITDADVSALVTALPDLEHLRLGENNNPAPITDAALEELAKLKKLKELTLTETKLSDAALAKLQKALPDCVVKK